MWLDSKGHHNTCMYRGSSTSLTFRPRQNTLTFPYLGNWQEIGTADCAESKPWSHSCLDHGIISQIKIKMILSVQGFIQRVLFYPSTFLTPSLWQLSPVFFLFSEQFVLPTRNMLSNNLWNCWETRNKQYPESKLLNAQNNQGCSSFNSTVCHWQLLLMELDCEAGKYIHFTAAASVNICHLSFHQTVGKQHICHWLTTLRQMMLYYLTGTLNRWIAIAGTRSLQHHVGRWYNGWIIHTWHFRVRAPAIQLVLVKFPYNISFGLNMCQIANS